MKRGEEGMTLIEILVTITIMSIAFVTIMAGMFTAVVASDHNVKQTTAEALTRAYAEFYKGLTFRDSCPHGYDDSGFVSTLDPDSFTSSMSINYWDSAAGTFTATCSTSSNIQRITVGIASIDSRGTAQIEVVKRRA